MATYTIGERGDLASAERLPASVEVSPANAIRATVAEKARAAVYVFLALAALAFLVATLVLYLG
jgi:hypothetical protein